MDNTLFDARRTDCSNDRAIFEFTPGFQPVFQENQLISRVLSLTLICSLGFGGLAQEKLHEDVKRLQGSWEWDPAVKQPDPKSNRLEGVVFKGNTLTFKYSLEGLIIDSPNIFKIEATASPKKIDFFGSAKDDPYDGKPFLGLYELKDGELKICYRGPGSSRPKSFNDKADGKTSTTFITLKRSPGA